MSSRSKLSVLVRSGRRGERADRRRPECDEVAAVVRNVQRLDWSAPRDIQERDRAVPQLPSRHERPRRDALDVHHAPDRTGHPRPDCPHKRICLETPLPLSDGCKRPERLLVDSRSGRGAAAPPGPSCPGVLHRHSVGALTSCAAFPVTASAFAIACREQRSRPARQTVAAPWDGSAAEGCRDPKAAC